MTAKEYAEKSDQFQIIEWTGENLHEVIALTGLNPSVSHLSWSEYEQLVRESGLKIFTSEGTFKADIGDVIVKDTEGKLHLCSLKFLCRNL